MSAMRAIFMVIRAMYEALLGFVNGWFTVYTCYLSE